MYQKPDFIRVDVNIRDNFASYATAPCSPYYGGEDRSIYLPVGNADIETCDKELYGEYIFVPYSFPWLPDNLASCYRSHEPPAGI